MKTSILMLVFVMGKSLVWYGMSSKWIFFNPRRTSMTLRRAVKRPNAFLSLSLLYTQIELIDRVDDIYRNTSWDNAGFKGYGIQIEQVFINRCGL